MVYGAGIITPAGAKASNRYPRYHPRWHRRRWKHGERGSRQHLAIPSSHVYCGPPGFFFVVDL